MIQGFKIETAPLTDYERETVLPAIIALLQERKGSRRAITSKRICAMLDGYQISEPRVRKIINHIRTRDLVPCLIANSGGYYIAQSEDEMLNYEESLLGREEAIHIVRRAMERQRRLVYGDGQQTLFG